MKLYKPNEFKLKYYRIYGDYFFVSGYDSGIINIYFPFLLEENRYEWVSSHCQDAKYLDIRIDIALKMEGLHK